MPAWFGHAALLFLAVAAVLRGGREERLATGALVANVALTLLMRDWSWPEVQWGGFAFDLVLLGLLFTIAMRSEKFWPLPAAAFQLLIALTHTAKLLDSKVHQWAYLTAIVIWTYALMATLGVGIWNSWRARRYLARTAPAVAADTRR